MNGIMFDEYHSYNDFGLILTSVALPNPEAKLYEVDIPGADGALDLTEAFGGIRYNQRILNLSFAFTKGYAYRYTRNSQIANQLHGKKMKIIMDEDPAFYYLGRVNFSEWVVDKSLGILSFSITADPYKYELLSSTDDWLWDPFDLETGIIRGYKDIAVSGTTDVIVIGSERQVVPTIITSAAMTVTFESNTYSLVAGSNKIYDIEIRDGEYTLTFTGNGTVTIEFTGGSL